MTARRVLVATASFARYSAAPLQTLQAAGLEVVLNEHGRTLSSGEVAALADGCVGIVAGTERYTRDVLARCRGLRVISRCGAGLDTIDLNAAGEAGVAICSTPFGPTQAVAELTAGLILSLVRQIEAHSLRVKRGVWRKEMGFLLEERTVGILGLGRIGRRLAELLRAWGAPVIGCDIRPDPSWAAARGVALLERDEVIRRADVLCLHLPYEDGLRHLIGAAELRTMKPGSFLVNTSRGGLVDEQALHDALVSGHLAGAALDTFEQEPYRGPLCGLETVILTPHVGSYARAGRVKMEQDAADNLLAELRRLALLPVEGRVIAE